LEDTAGGEGAEGVDAAWREESEDAAQDNAGDADMKEGDVELAGVLVEEDAAEDGAGNTESEKFAKEDDVEFAAVQTSTNRVNRRPMYLWESYRDWLKLTTVHFEAIKIITGFITVPSGARPLISPSISIRVLAPGHQGYKMLSWEDALKEYLPEPKISRAPDSATETIGCEQTLQPDVQTLIDFIKKTVNDDCAAVGVLLKEVKQSLGELDKTCVTPPSTNSMRVALRKVRGKLSGLIELGSSKPIYDDKIDFLVKSVTDLKVIYNTTAGKESIDVAIRKIESLKTRSPFTEFKGETRLSNGIFSGTIHCELCLATLVYLADRDKSGDDTQAFEGLLEKFKVKYHLIHHLHSTHVVLRGLDLP
jgi:hypothetical protein